MTVLAAAAHTKADYMAKAALQEATAHRVWFFLAGVIGICTVINWTSKALAHVPSLRKRVTVSDIEGISTAQNKSSLSRLPSAVATTFKSITFRYGIPTPFGSVLLVSELGFILSYAAINFTLLLIRTQHLQLFWYEDRAAHLASVQLPLIVGLAGKNNVLSFLTGVSHEKLNVLHRAAARVCLIMLWIHFLGRYTSGLPAVFSFEHDWMRAGALGLGAFSLAALLSVRPIRQIGYEFFLVSHIILILIFLVAGYYHTRDPGYSTYIWPALLIWAFDRFTRVCRLLVNNRIWRGTSSKYSQATVDLVNDDTIRLTITRKMTWKAGQHAYVLLPSVSTLPTEAHPFSISTISGALDGSDGPAEKEITFLVRTRSGFTQRMRAHAQKQGKFNVPAYIDGPYGCPPDLRSFDTSIFVCGGSGVSYTLPLLLNLVHLANAKKSNVRRIVFVWSVRRKEHIEWVAPSLDAAMAAKPANLVLDIRIFVTSSPALESAASLEKQDSLTSQSPDTVVGSPADKEGSKNEFPLVLSHRTTSGRPDVPAILKEEIGQAVGTVSVDVCGPSALADTVRGALRSEGGSGVLKGRAPVTLHVETFGM